MKLTERRRWRGRIRATLKDCSIRCLALMAWNNRNPGQGLLTDAQEITLLNANALCNLKLDEKILM